MDVFAYCAERFERPTRTIAGVEPLTSPPLDDVGFDPAWLSGHDLVVFNLHGLPHEPGWYGAGRGDDPDDLLPTRGPLALSADTLRRAKLDGAVVFAVNCYLGEIGSPMLAALLDAGASAVLAGAGENFGGVRGVRGADLLGLWFRWGLALGWNVDDAFRMARHRLKLSLPTKAIRDALAFELVKDTK